MRPQPSPERNRRLIQRHVSRLALTFAFLAANMVAVGKIPATTANTVFVFRGRIQAVNPAAGTFTLRAEKKTYVFIVTAETKIGQNGASQKLTDLKPDQFAEVEMKVGPGGKGVASSVKLTSYSNVVVQSLLAATTPGGETMSAEQVKPLILDEPLPRSLFVTGRWAHKNGVFLLSVRSDGTVSNVEILQSIGQPSMDFQWTKTLMKWRFRPNSVEEVRVPGDYGGYR